MHADTDLDKIINEFINKKIKQFSGVKQIKAGVIENATYDDGTKVSEVARKNEYGLDGNPPRSFFRSTQKNKFNDWFNKFTKLCQRDLQIQQIAHQIGTMMRKDIIKKIDSNMPPPNSKETLIAWSEYKNNSKNEKVRQKRAQKLMSNKRTLIFSGEMQNSINYEIVKE